MQITIIWYNIILVGLNIVYSSIAMESNDELTKIPLDQKLKISNNIGTNENKLMDFY